MEQAQMIADAYCQTLAAWLDQWQLDKIAKGEAWPDDYCDGNIAMEAAFISLCIPLWDDATDAMRDDAIDIWNRAYDIAQARGFR
jgi:hypothetical protein